MIFRQLFDKESSTYTYILGDPETRKAAIVDAVIEQVDRDAKVLEELSLELEYAFETHVHADHITGAGELRSRLGVRTVFSERGASCADLQVKDGDRVRVGSIEVGVRATPGHTNGCLTYVVSTGSRTIAFTGDALLVRGCGRTDFQQGDARTLYRSIHEKIFTLPDDALLYPAHDYRGHTVTTVGEEKRHNPRLNLSVTEDRFVEIMAALKLPNPKMMDIAVPANAACGRVSS
jgi:glyoxylase-like metal-dependent hydrolase (beta-lactamase superfamily II)